jgi:transposase
MSAPQNARLSALRTADPDRWRSEVAAAFRSELGHIRRAAKRLGVGQRTLCRWLACDAQLREARWRSRQLELFDRPGRPRDVPELLEQTADTLTARNLR